MGLIKVEQQHLHLGSLPFRFPAKNSRLLACGEHATQETPMRRAGAARIGATMMLMTLLATATGCAVTPPPDAATRRQDPTPFPTPPGPGREAILAFWTPDRMAQAWAVTNPPPWDQPPLDPPVPPGSDHSGYTTMPAPYADHPLSRVTGILFMRNGGEGSERVGHCSASVLRSNSRNLILTAAHCVRSFGEWRDMLLFVPAFDGTTAPLGKWPVRQAFLPSEDADQATETDLAVARVYSATTTHRQALTLEEAVGVALTPSTSIDESFVSVKVTGYPAQPRPNDPVYAYAEQRQCDTPAVSSTSNDMRLRLTKCTPQGGNSGGPIIYNRIGPPFSVVAVFTNTVPDQGQTRLQPAIFMPSYEAADALPPDSGTRAAQQ